MHFYFYVSVYLFVYIYNNICIYVYMFVLVEYLGTHNYCRLAPFPEGIVYSDKIYTIAQLPVNKLPRAE